MKYLGIALIILSVGLMALVSYKIFVVGHSLGTIGNAASVAITLAMAGAGITILRQSVDPMAPRMYAKRHRVRSPTSRDT